MKFMIAENKLTMKRVSFQDGKIVVDTIKRGGLTDEQRKLVAGAHLDPMAKLSRIEAAVKAGKVDAASLKSILEERPDFDALMNAAT